MATLTPTAAGCDIAVRAHNKGNANVTIDLEDSEVKNQERIVEQAESGRHLCRWPPRRPWRRPADCHKSVASVSPDVALSGWKAG